MLSRSQSGGATSNAAPTRCVFFECAAQATAVMQPRLWPTSTAHLKNTQRVGAALLVAPPDCDRESMRHMLPSWSSIPLQKLPFPSVMFASSNDPFCALERARFFADAWGSELVEAGPRGHLNADSGLEDWPEALLQLKRLASAGSPTNYD